MAGSSRFDDLRREITSLVVENDELRQMVDILRENQELRDVLRTQYNESGALLPVLESTRVDEQDQIGGQPRLNITTWERRNFVPGRGPFRFDRRRPLDTSSVSANSWLVLSPDRRQHGRSRALPDANQAGAGFLQDFSFSEDFPRFAEQEGFMCSTPIQAHPAFSPLGGQAGPAAQAAPQDTAWSFSTREGSRSGARCSTPIQTHPQIGALPDWALSPLGGQAGPAAQAGPQDTTCSFPTVFSPAHTPTAMRPPYSYASLGSITPLSYISSIDDSVFTRARQASPLSSGSIFSPVPPPGPQAVAGTQGGPQYFTFSPPLGQITVPATQPALTGSQPGGTESSAPGAPPPAVPPAPLVTTARPPPLQLPPPRRMTYPPLSLRPTQDAAPHFTLDSPFVFRPPRTGLPPSPQQLSQAGPVPPPYSYSSLGSFTPLSSMDLALADSVFSPAHASFSFSPQGSLTPPGPQAVAGTQGGPQYFTFSPPLGQITVPATQPALTGSQPGGTESSAPGAPPPAVPPAPLVTAARPPPLQLPPPRRMTYPPLSLRPTQDAAPHFTLDSPFVFRPPRTGLPPSPQQLSQAGPVPPPYSYSSLGSFTPLSSMDLALDDSVFSPAHASFSFSPQGSLTPPGPQAVVGTQGGPQYFTFSPPLGQITVPATQPAPTDSQPGGMESSAPGATGPVGPADGAGQMGAAVGPPPNASPLAFNFSPTYLHALAQAHPLAMPPVPLVRQARPPPLQLPPMGPMTYPPLRLRPTQDAAPHFTLDSFMHMPPRPGAQVTELPPKAPEGVPKERRGADRHAMSIRISHTKPSKDSKQVTMERIVGEIAFQLDRRILSAIFPDRVRLYGFNVSDIPEKIAQSGGDPQSGLTEDQRTRLTERYTTLMNRLKTLGYDPNIHPSFTEHIVNTYGILRERPDMTGPEGDAYNNIEFLRNVVQNIVPADQSADCMMLLSCLHLLSQDDGKPLFIW